MGAARIFFSFRYVFFLDKLLDTVGNLSSGIFFWFRFCCCCCCWADSTAIINITITFISISRLIWFRVCLTNFFSRFFLVPKKNLETKKWLKKQPFFLSRRKKRLSTSSICMMSGNHSKLMSDKNWEKFKMFDIYDEWKSKVNIQHIITTKNWNQ